MGFMLSKVYQQASQISENVIGCYRLTTGYCGKWCYIPPLTSHTLLPDLSLCKPFAWPGLAVIFPLQCEYDDSHAIDISTEDRISKGEGLYDLQWIWSQNSLWGNWTRGLGTVSLASLLDPPISRVKPSNNKINECQNFGSFSLIGSVLFYHYKRNFQTST